MERILVLILCLPGFLFAQKLTFHSGKYLVSEQNIFNINGISLDKYFKGIYHLKIKTKEVVINKKLIYQ